MVDFKRLVEAARTGWALAPLPIASCALVVLIGYGLLARLPATVERQEALLVYRVRQDSIVVIWRQAVAVHSWRQLAFDKDAVIVLKPGTLVHATPPYKGTNGWRHLVGPDWQGWARATQLEGPFPAT